MTSHPTQMHTSRLSVERVSRSCLFSQKHAFSPSIRPFIKQSNPGLAQSLHKRDHHLTSSVRTSTADRVLEVEELAGQDSLPEEASTSEPTLPSRRMAVFKAAKRACHPIEEKSRPLAEYMTLPASQYSVLDAKKIERIDEDSFRCYVGGLHFLNIVVEPVLTVSVVVEERGPVVKLLSTKLEGSKAVVAANERFTATMTNRVRWEAAEAGEAGGEAGVGKQITSDTSIEVSLEVPGWASFLPVSAVEAAGSSVMHSVLQTAVPRFLKQLGKDYELWAEGDESRKPVADGEL